MKLLNELQERRRVLCEARDVMRADLLQTEAELYDLYRAIGALEPAVEVVPEPEPELQDDASEFAEEGYAPVTKPYRVIADEDYERVTYDFATMAEATACYDEFVVKPIARVDLYVLHEDGHGLQEWVKHSSFYKPAPLVEHAPVTQAEPLADPIWNEPEPTKPEADALAKAADYYSPEAVAERNKFNPFAMFRKEGDQ